MGLPGDRSEVSAATMPFGIGPVELIIVLVIALLVLGPGKLPDVGAALGKSIREFRKAATEVEEATKLEAVPTAAATPTTAATPTPSASPTASASPTGPVPAVTPAASAPGADSPTEPQA